MPRKTSLTEYPSEWVETLRQQLPIALTTFDAKAVHQSRVATRRLQAVVDVAGPVLDKSDRKAFVKILKRLRRQLGPIRDGDVQIDRLGQLPQGPGVEWLVARLKADVDACRKKAANTIDLPKEMDRLAVWSSLRDQCDVAGDELARRLRLSLSARMADFVAHADAVAAGDEHESADRLDPHALRIAGKGVRYTVEWAVATKMRLGRSVVSSFKKMQDQLGDWHDEVVTVQRALRASTDAELFLHDPPAQAAVLEVARRAVGRSTKHLDRFKAIWKSKGQAVVEAVYAATIEAPVIGTRTDPGLFAPGNTSPPVEPTSVDPEVV